MATIKILQCGIPKSGNFWLYKIIQQVLGRAGLSTSSFIEQQPIYALAKSWELNFPEQARIDVLDITDLQCSYRISSIYRMPVVSLQEYVKGTNHVWTHSPVCKKSEEVFNLFDKKVYIIRDPRDRVLSAAKYYCSPYFLKYFPHDEPDPLVFLEKNFDKLMHNWVWHVFDHLRLSREYNIHICFYEGFLLNFNKELNRLLDYLEVSLSSDEQRALKEAVSFNVLKEKNPKHLNKGVAGAWVNRLSAAQQARAEIIAGPLIRYLNFSSIPSESFAIPSVPPFHDYSTLKEEITESQEALYQH